MLRYTVLLYPREEREGYVVLVPSVLGYLTEGDTVQKEIRSRRLGRWPVMPSKGTSRYSASEARRFQSRIDLPASRRWKWRRPERCRRSRTARHACQPGRDRAAARTTGGPRSPEWIGSGAVRDPLGSWIAQGTPERPRRSEQADILPGLVCFAGRPPGRGRVPPGCRPPPTTRLTEPPSSL